MFISNVEKEQIRRELASLRTRIEELEKYTQQAMRLLKDYLEETSRTLNDPAPYGYRKDGQPKKKPGRPAK